VTSTSPTVRRRELGARLRAIRLATGMTVEDVAGRMEVSAAKISRIETGARGVSVADVRFLCNLYEVSADENDRLISLTRESKRRSWWQQYGLPESVFTYIGLEEAAVSIHQYDTSFVPPLLQTEEYARAVIKGVALGTPADHIDQLVDARMTRQKLLSSPAPPELWTVIDQAAVVRMVGGPSTMRAQLEALVEHGQRPPLTLQVIPFDAGAHPGMGSAFTLLHLEEVSDVAYVEGLIGNFYLQSPADLARYHKAFDQLRAIALSPGRSQDLLHAFASQLSG
jgi:transcriptional regulator with XRE-family HTH domain